MVPTTQGNLETRYFVRIRLAKGDNFFVTKNLLTREGWRRIRRGVQGGGKLRKKAKRGSKQMSRESERNPENDFEVCGGETFPGEQGWLENKLPPGRSAGKKSGTRGEKKKKGKLGCIIGGQKTDKQVPGVKNNSRGDDSGRKTQKRLVGFWDQPTLRLERL